MLDRPGYERAEWKEAAVTEPASPTFVITQRWKGAASAGTVKWFDTVLLPHGAALAPDAAATVRETVLPDLSLCVLLHGTQPVLLHTDLVANPGVVGGTKIRAAYFEDLGKPNHKVYLDSLFKPDAGYRLYAHASLGRPGELGCFSLMESTRANFAAAAGALGFAHCSASEDREWPLIPFTSHRVHVCADYLEGSGQGPNRSLVSTGKLTHKLLAVLEREREQEPPDDEPRFFYVHSASPGQGGTAPATLSAFVGDLQSKPWPGRDLGWTVESASFQPSQHGLPQYDVRLVKGDGQEIWLRRRVIIAGATSVAEILNHLYRSFGGGVDAAAVNRLLSWLTTEATVPAGLTKKDRPGSPDARRPQP